mmetsp:Transcript_11758/g.13536  ORF Transcript_11758/g.13536 Transcript_11758/m.13536 type:complete len:354 (-) Transcript_11758:846-1907(-)
MAAVFDRRSSVRSVSSDLTVQSAHTLESENEALELTNMLEDMKVDADLEIEKLHEKEMLVIDGKFPERAHFSCPRSLPIPSIWPDRPLLFRQTRVHYGYDESSESKPWGIHEEAHDFETDLFVGSVIIRIRDSPGTDSYFEGKKRKSSFVITGRFKKELSCSTVTTGQEFCHPVKTPGVFLSKALLKFFKILAPLLKAEIGVDETYFLSPVIQTVQALNVSATPLILSRDMKVEEDLTLMGGDFAEGGSMHNASFARRKKYFSKSKILSKYSFDTTNYYTFDFYDDKIDLNTMTLSVLKKKFDLTKYLNGQPLRILSRIVEPDDENPGKYLWNFELWHEKQTADMKLLNMRES